MKHLGHISIQDNKIIFVYYKLPEPYKDDYIADGWIFLTQPYEKAIKEYNASKREVEVENYKKISDLYFMKHKNGTTIIYPDIDYELKNGTKCEAEVENGIATIVKIL